jgi:hypothetical protein
MTAGPEARPTSNLPVGRPSLAAGKIVLLPVTRLQLGKVNFSWLVPKLQLGNEKFYPKLCLGTLCYWNYQHPFAKLELGGKRWVPKLELGNQDSRARRARRMAAAGGRPINTFILRSLRKAALSS